MKRIDWSNGLDFLQQTLMVYKALTGVRDRVKTPNWVEIKTNSPVFMSESNTHSPNLPDIPVTTCEITVAVPTFNLLQITPMRIYVTPGPLSLQDVPDATILCSPQAVFDTVNEYIEELRYATVGCHENTALLDLYNETKDFWSVSAYRWRMQNAITALTGVQIAYTVLSEEDNFLEYSLLAHDASNISRLHVVHEAKSLKAMLSKLRDELVDACMTKPTCSKEYREALHTYETRTVRRFDELIDGDGEPMAAQYGLLWDADPIVTTSRH